MKIQYDDCKESLKSSSQDKSDQKVSSQNLKDRNQFESVTKEEYEKVLKLLKESERKVKRLERHLNGCKCKEENKENNMLVCRWL